MKLLAPNGKPSNLTPEQYKLVRTPEFKEWFGDWESSPEIASKVVDENGEPLVVYHGTFEKFNKFDYSKSKRYQTIGWHFGSLKQAKKRLETKIANTFKVTQTSIKFPILECFLNVRRLTIIDRDFMDWDKEYAIKYVMKKINSEVTYKNLFRLWRPDGKYDFDWLSLHKVLQYYSDGIRYKNVYEGKGISWIVFNPNNIKLADGTNTTFDVNNPDIRFEKGGRTIAQTPAPKKDRVYGSKKNKPKSAESSSKASSIILNPKTISSIKSKIEIHNDKFPKKKIPLSTAKAVVRRGMGAYSSSHRPTIRGGKPNSRVAWGLARLNAFIYKIQKGYSKSGKYTQDDDLINELGYRVKKYESGGRTFNDKELLAKYKRGESIGFTGIAHLKAKGLIKRADGTIRKSDKYKYSEGGNLGKYAFADDRDDDIYYQKETIGKFARKIQGNKFEENTKKENQLIEKLIDWTNSSDAYNSNYFFNNKKIFEEGLKKHPEIFNPSLSDGDKFIYRGLQKLNNSLKKQLSLDLNDYVKLDLKQLSLFGVAGDSYYFMKKPINYEPERKAQSWTKDIKVASRFGLEGILVTHIDKNFFMNPDFMNVVRGAEKENEVIHIGKDFIKNNYLMISQTVYEDLSIKAKGKSYKDIISSVKYNVGGKINFQPSVKNKHKEGGEIILTTEQVEDLLGRKLEIWNDSVVTINGQQYKKTFLKSEYRRL
jgi:hypothetical protein